MRLYSILNSATVGIGELCQGGECGASGMVVPGKICLRLHLDQAAGSALKFESQPLAAVKLRRLGGRRHHGFDAAIIELVDQHDETPRGIVVRRREYGDVGDEHGPEEPCEVDIVVLAARTFAELA